MPSPAQQHFMRATAAAASAAAAADNPLENATGYELMLAKLAEDRRHLKGVQSMEAKADLKRKLLPEYAPWVDGALAAGQGAQDDVLMTVMVWRIDAADYAGALAIAGYAIEHGLKLPDQYQRTTATLIVEEFADAAKRARDGGQGADVASLIAVEQLTSEQDMPDQVRAKLHKEIGLALYGQVLFEKVSQEVVDAGGTALDHLKRATQLNDKVGVKKDIEKLERELKNAAASLLGGS